jgi:hypothetical protein
MLFGDSLVGKTENMFSFSKDIGNALRKANPTFEIHVSTSGLGGNTIEDLNNRVERDVLHLKLDAIMVYWDSDASDNTGQNKY